MIMLILTSFLIGSYSAVGKSKNVIIQPDDIRVTLTKRVHYIEDKKNSFKLEDFLQKEKEGKLIKSDEDSLSFGYRKSAYWLSVDVISTEKRKMLLEVDWPQLDNLDIYQLKKGKIIQHHALGDKRKFFERPVDHRNFLVPIELIASEEVKVVFRVSTDTSVKIGIFLNDPYEFIKSDTKRVIIHGLYFGAMLVMLLYNTFIYITLKSSTYLFYVIFVFSHTLIYLHLTGFDYQYLWPNSPFIHEKSLSVNVGLTIWSCAYFTFYFLNLKSFMPRIAKVLQKIGLLAAAIGIASILLPYSFSIMILNAIGFCEIILLISIGIGALKQGNSEAKYYLIAAVSYLIGAMFVVLLAFGILPEIFITKYGMQIGSALMVILFSIALASRIKRLQEENINIQKEAAENLQVKIENATAKITAQTEQLKELDYQKTTFFQNVSHELRSPLTLILNPLESAIQRMPEDKEIRSAARNSRRLLRLVNQLLDFQKISAGKKKIDLAPVNLTHFMKICGDYFASACSNKAIDFSIKFDGETLTDEHAPRIIMGEIDSLEKMTFNYLSNALKFSPRGGTIELGIKKKDSKVRLYVSDNGRGISGKDQEKLFQIFSQIDSPHYSAAGTGLGLALVESLAKEMNAEVGVESESKKGSVFWIDFPLSSDNKNVAKILVVESNEKLRKKMVDSIVKNMKIERNEIKVASTVADAIRIMEHHFILLIVADYDLHGPQNGLDLLKEVYKRYPKAYKILMTTDLSFDLLERGANKKLADQFFKKTSDTEELINRIEIAIAQNMPKNSNLIPPTKKIIDVLIVEDDQGLLKSLLKLLSKSDPPLICEGSSSLGEARDLLDNFMVRCVLSDYHLGDQNGLHLMQEVEEYYPETKRILMTGTANPRYIDAALNKGKIHHIFYKPLDYEALIETLTEIKHKSKIIQNRKFERPSWSIDEEDEIGQVSLGDITDNQKEGKGEIILVVDDLAEMRNLIQSILNKAHYRVVLATNGKEAIELAAEIKPDLIITDWMMTVMGGPELITRLKEDPEMRPIPVILLTAKSDEESKIIGTEIGADAFLGKPFNLHELICTVHNLLQLKSSEVKLKHTLEELKQTSERELNHAKNLLTQSEKLASLGSMVSSIGHEISNPISLIGIECFNEKRILNKLKKTLDFSKPTEEGKQLHRALAELEIINTAITTGAKRLKDLSLALRTQSRMEKVPSDRVDLNQIIRESMLIVRGRTVMHKITESFGDIVKVTCYPSKVGQIITNLLANAADSVSEKAEELNTPNEAPYVGEIRVSSEVSSQNDNPGVLITIADNGGGVPADIKDRIFEQFFTTKKAGSGTGLGLSLSIHLAKEHGGTLQVKDDSLLGGARFELWLPVTLQNDNVDHDAA